MHAHHRSSRRFGLSLPFVLLTILLVTLWIAGGASKADTLSQVVVRCVCWALIAVMALLGGRPDLQLARPVLLLLSAALVLTLFQLIPLPPAFWQSLPARDLFVEAAAASGLPQPWRPWAIVPGATANAAWSLVVPAVTLLLVVGLRPAERERLPGVVLAMIAAMTLVALLQFSGSGSNNPLVNDTPGEVSGTFANRNHLALFLAMGCLIAPVWAFLDEQQRQWRAPAAIGIVVLLVLTILATGSRAGLALGVVGLAIGLGLAWRNIRRALRRYPRWVFFSLIAAIVGMVVIFVLIAIAADRAVAINRALAIDPSQDMRSRGLPTVLAMIATYFPFGSGIGGFDPIFRIHEPFALLKPTYFNHAHNDWLEIVLDGGLAGALLALAGLTWWGRASVRAWRADPGKHHVRPRLGSALLFLIFAASVFDYPARTPMMMAMMVIAALWLTERPEREASTALP